MDSYLLAIGEHITISACALIIAAVIGVPAGCLGVRFGHSRRWITGLFQMMRIIPSLAILLLLIPVMGTGVRPAVTALVILGIPPILLNTAAGLAGVPEFMLETAAGCGMTGGQIWRKVHLPLAMPMILAGLKTALVEIIASATLAAKIGAGGLGGIIFTGLGINRFDLLIIGGVSVAALSLSGGLLFGLADQAFLTRRHVNRQRRTHMKLSKKLASILMLILIFTQAACSFADTSDAIRIGSKDFTENLVVAEIYALALEDAGYQVARNPGISGSIIHTAIISDEIDIYPEYTGTALLSILKQDLITDPDEVYRVVKEEYERQFALVWLDSSQANDSQGLVIRTELAQDLGITTISGLQARAGLIRFASQGEFDQRDDGIPGLEKVYGPFRFSSSKVYDNGLKYQVLGSKEADAAPVYTTEGQLMDTEQFTVLEDDLQMWPPYYLAPVVQKSVLDANPGIAEVLNQVSAALDTESVIRLNAAVDVDKREYEEVAKEFWESIQE